MSCYKGNYAGRIVQKFRPGISLEAPIPTLLRRLRDRGLISGKRPWPIAVQNLSNVSYGDNINWFAGIAASTLSYYKYSDNQTQVRMMVDHMIRWSAIFTQAHQHKASARKILIGTNSVTKS